MAGNRTHRRFPGGIHGKEWLYLIGLADGTIKLGATKSPRDRLATHRCAFGEGMLWVHLFQPTSAGNEYTALKRLAAIGTPVRAGRRGPREIFSGITKDAAIRTVRAVLAEHIEYQSRQREVKAARAAWAKFKAEHFPHLTEDGLFTI